jgi:hypothetical protein
MSFGRRSSEILRCFRDNSKNITKKNKIKNQGRSLHTPGKKRLEILKEYNN